MIPIIDIFAGPGGLGEGFSSLLNDDEERVFKIRLSIEKDPHAQQTLKLRSFFREFRTNQVPDEYYAFVRGEITLEQLYKRFPEQAALAELEACCGTLGVPDDGDTNALTNEEVDNRIQNALEGRINWVLIGGPPCQAYSLVGRARRQEIILDEAKDKRVGLYKEYLRIIAVHKPAVFVMENVKGILSAKTEENLIFSKILNDLSDPVSVCISEGEIADENQPHIRYRIFSLTKHATNYDLINGNPVFKPEDFIIRSENYGVPQRRHRVILLGIREDIPAPENILEKKDEVSLSSVIGNLPEIRSGITREFTHFTIKTDENGNPKKKRHYNKVKDSFEIWSANIGEFNNQINNVIGIEADQQLMLPNTLGEEFIQVDNYDLPDDHPLLNWYLDHNLNGILHHVSRKHLLQDIKRYMFASRYTELHGKFPRLEDYRIAGDDLMPDHENAESGKFTDRFRVQLPNIPATTVTSHISKDGHYFIHYDPRQSRSFTVREAARVQTFPDNYYFCGGRTQQFHQVGNAVPPYLAYQIASIVAEIFSQIPIQNNEVVREQHF